MSTALEFPTQYAGIPHRKPLPTGSVYPTGVTGNDQIYTRQPASHSHTRSASSSTMPSQYAPQHPSQQYPQHAYQQQMAPSAQTQSRRTLSNATSSTTSSGPNSTNNLARAPTSSSNSSNPSNIRRSTSSRSNTPTSYVALMRKQKATVWCDRAQHEDPRLLAAQRAAKMRANIEVVGGTHATGARTQTTNSGGIAGGVRSKIRHHGAVKASAYTGGPNMSGAGVPMRLSASEVDEADSDDEKGYDSGSKYHQRNGSGRSSLGSAHQRPGVFGPGTSYAPSGLNTGFAPQQPGHTSNSSTPPSAASYSPDDPGSSIIENAGIPSPSDPGETPMPDMYASQQNDYFDHQYGSGPQGQSTGSGSSEERVFGEAGGLPKRYEPKRKTSEELRRRGSVDDRTTTMSGVRLFVANPDLSD